MFREVELRLVKDFLGEDLVGISKKNNSACRAVSGTR